MEQKERKRHRRVKESFKKSGKLTPALISFAELTKHRLSRFGEAAVPQAVPQAGLIFVVVAAIFNVRTALQWANMFFFLHDNGLLNAYSLGRMRRAPGSKKACFGRVWSGFGCLKYAEFSFQSHFASAFLVECETFSHSLQS